MKSKVTLNKKQRLYVIPCGGGYSCLGFDVCMKRAAALARELGLTFTGKRGLLRTYKEYQALVQAAFSRNKATGWRSKTELHPQLIGLEGRRVEVTDADGETYRFNVGKSTGHIPCHLQIHNRRSYGGPAVDSRPFQRVTVIR
jgi:hypothetical protein